MTKAPKHHKTMKNRMIERYFLDAVQKRTRRICNTSGDQPEQSLGGKAINKRRNCKNDNPTHKHIHQGRDDIVSAGKVQLQNDTGQRHGPGGCKNCPPNWAMQNNQCKRRIGAGYEYIDGCMVENSQSDSEF